MDPMIELRQAFLEECEELVGALESRLATLESGPRAMDDVNGAFRAIHSVKGGAGAFGFTQLVAMSHVFEAALDHVRAGRIAMDVAPYPLFLQAADVVARLVNAARAGQEEQAPPEMIRALEQVFSNADAATCAITASSMPEKAAASGPASVAIRVTPHGDLFRRAVDLRHVFAALESFGEVTTETVFAHLPPLAALNAAECLLRFNLTVRTDAPVHRIAESLELQLDSAEFTLVSSTVHGPDPAPAPAPVSVQVSTPVQAPMLPAPPILIAAPPAADVPALTGSTAAAVPSAAVPPPAAAQRQRAAGSIRVDLDRIDRLMNLVGEIVITQSMLDQRLLALSVADTIQIGDGLQVLARQTRELQETVMAVRAQPVRNVFQRMPRLVRELAQTLGKQARIIVVGEDTEVDKTIIEELADPLTHMIRNAMDHGLERADERAAAGKAVEGTVTLQAEQRGGRIVITIADDGRGINRDKLLAKARSRHLLPADARPSPEEIDMLLFHPGLSTADAVTDVSGRGVGMDVVKQNVEALGGRIVVASELGRGTRFTLLLPLTLAVMDGMVIRAGGERLVLPIASIRETLQTTEVSVEMLPNGQEFLRLRDRLSPLIRLAPRLGLGGGGDEQIIVITETDRGEHVGLAVDEIISQQQVVVKSLEASYGAVPGASAATILGDGLVALIIDVDALPTLPSSRARATHAIAPSATLH